MAVVFFHDVTVPGWSDELLHSMTILLHFGADFIYPAEDGTNPSVDERYPGVTFPMPGPGMFVEMLKKSMPPAPREGAPSAAARLGLGLALTLTLNP